MIETVEDIVILIMSSMLALGFTILFITMIICFIKIMKL